MEGLECVCHSASALPTQVKFCLQRILQQGSSDEAKSSSKLICLLQNILLRARYECL